VAVKVVASCERCDAELETKHHLVNEAVGKTDRAPTEGWLIVWGWKLNTGGREEDRAWCPRHRG